MVTRMRWKLVTFKITLTRTRKSVALQFPWSYHCLRKMGRKIALGKSQATTDGAARVFLEMHQGDGDQLFSRIVTGDESWVHHSTPETKRQSMVWKKPEESAPKKAKVTISAGKVMAMENFKWEIFTHPPHSPELAPSDFHLYPALKWHLGGKHFANDEEVQAEANHWLRRQDTAWYNSGDEGVLNSNTQPHLHEWQADLALKEMAASDMRNRRHVQPLLTWSTNTAHPVSLDQEPLQGHRKRKQFKQTDAFTRGMVIGLKRAARVDRRILRQAVAAPQATCTAILQHVQDTLDHSISTRTISRRLVANGLHSCRPLRRLPLTPPNRRQRLEWCRARSTWMTEWHRVVFSDESRFCLSSDSRRVRVWRRRGERSNPAAIVERPTVRQRGIMVWGAIAYDSRSPLLRIQGTMTAQRYVDDVLRPVTLPYLQGVPNALYQQDNARPHTARISQKALQDVQMLPWPPYSPDLSPIEHVWDIIGRRLHALPQPRSEDELWQMVEREWRAIPQDAIRTLIDSLPRRVAACIAVRGGPSCY
ncbi:Transposase [Cordylochernes scorpioides]|uniref:Transposase n=1 Tax=Cordylochernes scorpioides TaxID=51811 RepID=A0ABY6L737_9ARAC|nr:Transposase [Cordylochernes scorpioides]